MIESLRTTQIAFLRFAKNALWVFQGEQRRGTKSIRARVRARENHMKPFVRTSFLGTRPSCLPSPGRPLFDTDDRKPTLWLGRTGSPVKSQKHALRWDKKCNTILRPGKKQMNRKNVFLIQYLICFFPRSGNELLLSSLQRREQIIRTTTLIYFSVYWAL